MANEEWMYISGAQATMARLERLSAPRAPAAAPQNWPGDSRVAVGSRQFGQPVFQTPVARPANSTVVAGWICCGLGLACAWFLPPAQVFFVVAFILSIIAMSTHQVRPGTMLMITTSLSAAGCGLVFFHLVMANTLNLLNHTNAQVRAITQGVLATSPAVGIPAQLTINPNPYHPPAMVAGNPLTLNDVAVMLRTGFNDDEVIADAQPKQWVESLDGSQINYLRSLGAGDKLINFLRRRPTFIAPVRRPAPMPVLVNAVNPSLPAPAVYPRGPVAQEGVIGGNPMDYQAKDQRIKELKDHIDALDEEVRRIRTNPKDSRYWWHYAGRFNGIDQQAFDNYLKQLDQQRNDLRREKWRLEGR